MIYLEKGLTCLRVQPSFLLHLFYFNDLNGLNRLFHQLIDLLIKPSLVFERKTVILRDVPEQTTEEEIRSLFTGLGEIESVKMEFVGTWYE